MENYELVKALASRILFQYDVYFKFVLSSLLFYLDPTDVSDINEDNLEYYGHMANLVNLLIQLPDISRKEIIENFSKVKIL